MIKIRNVTVIIGIKLNNIIDVDVILQICKRNLKVFNINNNKR